MDVKTPSIKSMLRNPGRKPLNRIMIAIPMTGLLRSEWVIARYGQVIPCNWSQVDAIRWLEPHSPIDFLVADARNLMVDDCIKKGFEWLYFIDHDVILPPHTILTWNKRMIEHEIPVWSGLYFTKSRPSEPLVYRGRGSGYFADWKMGDLVWCDGHGMGCTIIHVSILKSMAKESEQYQVHAGRSVARVFETPARVWFNPEENSWYTAKGTEDLEWCSRVMEEGHFKKAGWDKYQDMEFPFLVDTSVFCRHIDFDGIQYPAMGEELEFAKGSEDEGKEKAAS